MEGVSSGNTEAEFNFKIIKGNQKIFTILCTLLK